ncbi:DUF4296 domain-containing protein [Flavobacterium sp.]|uniref:DUF4296 domain-containing protein n=1 Tax=Flavobacterium sp. TaxID=239 RepID=UPI003D11838D
MKRLALLVVIFIFSCKNEIVEKPKNLIDESTMKNILYDLAMLQAIKGHDMMLLPKNKIDPKKYIYLKYHIDSIQLVKSNRYYAADISNFKKMYEEILERIKIEKQENEKTLQRKNKQPK